jgi:cell division septum initiation protein DivIVA
VDALAKENSDLSAENEKLKAQIPHKKVAAKGKKKRHRSASSS